MAAFKWSGRTFGSFPRKITQSLDESPVLSETQSALIGAA